MKAKHLFKLLASALVLSSSSLTASIENQGDGTYKIEGYFYFNTTLEMVAPWGKNNDFGEFSTVIFKGDANLFPDIEKLGSETITTLIVKAQENPHPEADKEPILVVTEIIEWDGAPSKN